MAFRNGTAGDVQIAQHVVVLRAFMRDDLSDATSANDQYVPFHFEPSPLRTEGRESAKAALKIGIAECARDGQRSVGFFQNDCGHFNAVKPVLLDHGIACCVGN